MNSKLNKYKTLTVRAVQTAAMSLMLTKGVTTTREVKNLLQQAGYLAHHIEVSRIMEMLVQREEWGFVFNGVFREYFLLEGFDYKVPCEVFGFSQN